ncbi:hypothetical protein RRG08_038617 [Elysia crispata]|uniref:Uncharacterized protein n=1 Tax=Elysia crispata TaxID=231223 RepID=A0AAE0YKK2_9GAST|nr:hypothetical protein RRG08_038617 [Elysia crispata]
MSCLLPTRPLDPPGNSYFCQDQGQEVSPVRKTPKISRLVVVALRGSCRLKSTRIRDDVCGRGQKVRSRSCAGGLVHVLFLVDEQSTIVLSWSSS